jgi:carboxylate-amine ligase
VTASFGRHLTIGVEEELMLLDPNTLALTSGVERLLGPRGLKTELFSCLVETNTRICESAGEVLDELVRLRELAGGRARAANLAVAATGSHPFSRPEEQEIVAEPRYLAMLAERPGARRQLVCGLHVHVGMESFERCLERLEAVLPWLPAVLALSVNSPYLEAAAPGVLSARAGRLLELPRAGAPPVLDTVATWEGVVTLAGGDYTRIWWDVRPPPRLGTLEVRIADQQTDVRRSAGFAALVQALCLAAPGPLEPLSRELYLARRAAAARGEAAADDLLALVGPAARELGSWEHVSFLRGPPEALRQLEVGERDGSQAVAADLVSRSRV